MRISHYHAREFAADERTQIAACCDIIETARAEFAERFDVPAQYEDYATMLETEALDIVVVCTNETLHAEMTVQAAESGAKAVMCEKPMAMCLREADAMLETCERNGTLLAVGHQRRCGANYAAARERLDNGEIGALRWIDACGHPRSHLLADGTHTIDLIRYYAGDPAALWVFGQVDTHTGREAWGHPVEDAAMCRVGFEGGVQARFTSGGGFASAENPLGSAKAGNYHRIALYGQKGRMEIYGDSPLEGEPFLRISRGGETEDANPKGGWHEGRSPQRMLLDCLETGETHPLNGQNARAALEILMAVYESARLRRLIQLPLENKENPYDMILAERHATLGGE